MLSKVILGVWQRDYYLSRIKIKWIYMNRNFPKFSDRQVWANSADADQTAPRGAVWSGSTLFAILSVSFGWITLRKRHLVQLLGWLQQILWVSEYLGNLRYFNIFNICSYVRCMHLLSGTLIKCGSDSLLVLGGTDINFLHTQQGFPPFSQV